ncbi:MAG: hypothetical protein ACRBN8_23490 [Nannocystales bacterium]
MSVLRTGNRGPRPRGTLFAAVAMGLALGGCAADEEGTSSSTMNAGSESGSTSRTTMNPDASSTT